jgi:hypothetical protein
LFQAGCRHGSANTNKAPRFFASLIRRNKDFL